jgi:uncharacterized membrane protein YbaN (DUF454 family)
MDRKKRNKIFRLISAYAFIALGIVGLIFPIIPGIPLLIVGIYLLNPSILKKLFIKFKAKLSLKNQCRIQKLLDKFKRKKPPNNN